MFQMISESSTGRSRRPKAQFQVGSTEREEVEADVNAPGFEERSA
jgi:hypothetical protein